MRTRGGLPQGKLQPFSARFIQASPYKLKKMKMKIRVVKLIYYLIIFIIGFGLVLLFGFGYVG